MKNLSQFKKQVQLGVKMHAVNHTGHTGERDDQGMPIWKDIDLGIREISRVQSNSFALKTWKEGKQEWVDSWFQYPKAAECEYPGDNTVVVYETNRDGHRYKVLTYKIIE